MTGTRRRGAHLESAIFAATLDELAATSFEELTFERIAARAQAGKASVYSRWADTAELVLAALGSYDVPDRARPTPRTGDLRADLVSVLADFTEVLNAPHGRALRPLMTQRERHPDVYDRVYDLMVRPRHAMVTRIMHAAAERGEIDERAVTPLLVGTAPRLAIALHMETGRVSRANIIAIIDEIVLPALHRNIPNTRRILIPD